MFEYVATLSQMDISTMVALGTVLFEQRLLLGRFVFVWTRVQPWFWKQCRVPKLDILRCLSWPGYGWVWQPNSFQGWKEETHGNPQNSAMGQVLPIGTSQNFSTKTWFQLSQSQPIVNPYCILCRPHVEERTSYWSSKSLLLGRPFGERLGRVGRVVDPGSTTPM